MIVGDIVRKIGGTQKYKIVELVDEKAVCVMYPQMQSPKFTFKLSELEKVS